MLRSSNINEDHFVLNDDDVFVDESAVNIDLVHDGDILITAANGSPRLVGKRARISDLPGKTVHGGFMLVASSPCSDFLCASMGSSWYRRFLATGVAGGNGAIGNLDSKALGETIIAVPNDAEIDKLGNFFTRLDSLITLHQRKCQYRGLCGYLSWEQRKFGELYRPVSEKNDMSFGRDRIISVANMYFNSVVYVTEDSYLATYNVMRLGDIAFEGNRSKRFAHGRFVENTIGDGIVSHVFKVFRPVGNNFDLSYWKHAINNEKLMKDVLTRSTKASTMMHELVSSDFLEESTLVPSLDEQRAIGVAIDSIDNLITLHQ